MRNHDLVSDGFRAVTAASLVLLCSGLLAIALAKVCPGAPSPLWVRVSTSA
jgi:hypothetical protein